jgi:hypothetical protein
MKRTCPYRGVSWNSERQLWVARVQGVLVAENANAQKAYMESVRYRRANAIKLRRSPAKRHGWNGMVRVDIIVTKEWAGE